MKKILLALVIGGASVQTFAPPAPAVAQALARPTRRAGEAREHGAEPTLAEREQLAERSIPERFEKIVRMYPDRIALKTAFGRFVSCDDLGSISARMEAMGARELWQPMWKESV